MPNRCGLPISFFDQVDKRLDNVEGRLDTLDVGQSYLKDQINGLEADLSDAPSRKEFQELKSKVDQYHPAHD
jgi:cell division septum initiation protein DivIVA